MDATGTERAVMASLSTGAQYQFELARLAPERVLGAVFIGPLFPYTLSQYSLFTTRWPISLPLGSTHPSLSGGRT